MSSNPMDTWITRPKPYGRSYGRFPRGHVGHGLPFQWSINMCHILIWDMWSNSKMTCGQFCFVMLPVELTLSSTCRFWLTRQQVCSVLSLSRTQIMMIFSLFYHDFFPIKVHYIHENTSFFMEERAYMTKNRLCVIDVHLRWSFYHDLFFIDSSWMFIYEK